MHMYLHSFIHILKLCINYITTMSSDKLISNKAGSRRITQLAWKQSVRPQFMNIDMGQKGLWSCCMLLVESAIKWQQCQCRLNHGPNGSLVRPPSCPGPRCSIWQNILYEQEYINSFYSDSQQNKLSIEYRYEILSRYWKVERSMSSGGQEDTIMYASRHHL